MQVCVGIDEQEPLTGGRMHALVQCPRLSRPSGGKRGPGNQSHPRITGCERPYPRGRIVLGTVVDNKDLEIGIILSGSSGQACINRQTLVTCRDDQREPRVGAVWVGTLRMHGGQATSLGEPPCHP